MSSASHKHICNRTGDIHVYFVRFGLTYIYGTWQQLQDEGFITLSEAMPQGHRAQWRLNDCATLYAQRKWVPGTRGKGKVGVKLRDSDWWHITIEHDHFSDDDDELYRRREKLRREIHARSPEGQMERHRMINKLVKASADVAFQRLKGQLLAHARGGYSSWLKPVLPNRKIAIACSLNAS